MTIDIKLIKFSRRQYISWSAPRLYSDRYSRRALLLSLKVIDHFLLSKFFFPLIFSLRQYYSLFKIQVFLFMKQLTLGVGPFIPFNEMFDFFFFCQIEMFG